MSGVVAEVFGAAFRPRTSGWVRPQVRPGPGYRIGERSVVRLSRAVARGARWWESLHSGPTRMRSGRGGVVVRRGFGRGSAGARNQIRMGYMPRRGCRCTNLDRFEILVGRVSTGYVRSCLKRVACWGRQPGGGRASGFPKYRDFPPICKISGPQHPLLSGTDFVPRRCVAEAAAKVAEYFVPLSSERAKAPVCLPPFPPNPQRSDR